MRVVALVVSTAALAAAGSAAAGVWLGVVPSKVTPGAAIRVYGNAGSCQVGDTVYAISRLFPGDQFGREGALVGHVLHGGSFLMRGHVRAAIGPGRYVVTARCGGGNVGVPLYVRVTRRR